MEYDDFELLFNDVYNHVKNTGNKITISRLDRKLEFYSKQDKKLFVYEINDKFINSCRKFYDLLKNKNITLEQLINKQLLLFI